MQEVKERPGVYRISCAPNGRSYIGASARVYRRLSDHWEMLRKGRHDLVEMGADFAQYGEESFTFSILSFHDSWKAAELAEREVLNSSVRELLYNRWIPRKPVADSPQEEPSIPIEEAESANIIGTREAARLKRMTVAAFHYHIKTGHAPDADFIIGRQRFWTAESINSWQPTRKAKRKLPK